MPYVSAHVEIGDRVFAAVAPILALTAAGVAKLAGTVLAAGTTSDSLIAYGSTSVAVLAFAGLLVRQLVQSNSAWKEIVTSLRTDLEREKVEHNYTRWERESERFQSGKRSDPGPPPLPWSQKA